MNDEASTNGNGPDDLASGSLPEIELTPFERLEARVQALEADRDRFLTALTYAVEMVLKNPMASAMLPKQMKADLKTYLGTR